MIKDQNYLTMKRMDWPLNPIENEIIHNSEQLAENLREKFKKQKEKFKVTNMIQNNKINYMAQSNMIQNNVTLAQLREPKRSYKGIKSLIEYINENFPEEQVKQITPSILIELLVELRYTANKQIVSITNNRLYDLSNVISSEMVIRQIIENTDNTFENLRINFKYNYNIEGINTYDLETINYNLKDIYIVVDYLEIIKVKNDFLLEQKTKREEEIKKELNQYDLQVENNTQLMEDMIKYNITDPRESYKIRYLKAVEIIRDSKSTTEDVVNALHTLNF